MKYPYDVEYDPYEEEINKEKYNKNPNSAVTQINTLQCAQSHTFGFHFMPLGKKTLLFWSDIFHSLSFFTQMS